MKHFSQSARSISNVGNINSLCVHILYQKRQKVSRLVFLDVCPFLTIHVATASISNCITFHNIDAYYFTINTIYNVTIFQMDRFINTVLKLYSRIVSSIYIDFVSELFAHW